MIYLDNAATMRPFDEAIRSMLSAYETDYFNPSALYVPAGHVRDRIEQARAVLLSALGGKGKLYFTSCATESNTWAYTGGVKTHKGNVVVSMGEHASGYENAKALVARGLDVRFARLTTDGRVDEDDLLSKIDADTAFVSVLHCSNETGAVNDLATLTKAAKAIAPRLIFHSDGVQAFGKIPVDCTALGVDLYSISAHKIGGPKGVGGLWVKDGLHLRPLLIGGGQEQGNRSGTENVAGILSFAEAYACFARYDMRDIEKLHARMVAVLSALPGVEVNLPLVRSPYILSFSAVGAKAEILQRLLCDRGVIIGLGSACSSKQRNNRVLAAMGRTMPHIEGSARISFSPHNLFDDMSQAEAALKECIPMCIRK